MRVLGPAGLVAAVLHVGTVLAVGSQDSRFWSARHAISDMGMPGKPHQTAMNIGGLTFPGLLFVAFAWGTFEWLGREPRLGSILLALGGASFAAAGLFPFPARLHFPAVFVATVGFTVAVWLMGPAIGRRLEIPWIPAVSRLVGLLILGNIFLTTGLIPAPGYYQKITLAVGMTWLATTAYWMTSSAAIET